jgi:hypothetical protein
MQIAYLILAHNNYIHLQRLIDTLSVPHCRFYIHIDKKSSMPSIKGDNIFFVQNRVKVYHSSFSEVEATIKLLKLAAKDTDNEYFVLLSGADYPVKSNEEINEKLKSGGEFMQVLRWPNEYHPSSYFKYYYFNRVNRRSDELKKKFFVSIEKLLRKMRVKKKIRFQIYTGSQWFALSADCVKYILDELKSGKKYERFFKRCRFPCESFFHTVIGNSVYRERTKPHLTYIDFKAPGAEVKLDHLLKIKKGSFLFARKFSDDSTEVVEAIKNTFLYANSCQN